MNECDKIMEKGQRNPVDLITRLLLLLPPAFMTALKYDLPHVLVIVFLLILIPVFMKRYIPLKERPIIYTTLSMFALAIISGFFFDVKEERFSMMDVFLKSNIFIPFLIYCSAAACCFRRSRELTSVIAALAIMTELMTGDIFGVSFDKNIRFTGTTPLLSMYRSVYLWATVIQCLGIMSLLISDVKNTIRKQLFSVRIFRLISFAAMLIITYQCMICYYGQEDAVNKWSRTLRYAGRRLQFQDQKEFFPNETDVRDFTGKQSTDMDSKIILRVKASAMPGYLRGNVYAFYRQGMWRTGFNEKEPSSPERLKKDQSGSNTEFNQISLSSEQVFSGKQLPELEILPENDFHSKYLLVPGNAQYVRVIADNLDISAAGAVSASKWNTSAGYFAGVPNILPFTAAQEPQVLSEQERAIYLHRNGRKHYPLILFKILFRKNIKDQPKDATAKSNDPKIRLKSPKDEVPNFSRLKTSERQTGSFNDSVSKRSIVNLISQYLKNNYSYSLTPEKDGENQNGDPVRHFLTKSRKGHCELFATATVLLLRDAGIPARYVTGIVCSEKHPSGNFYYATARDAHAWAEAYLDDEKVWIPVDSVPAGALHNRNAEIGPVRTCCDLVKYGIQDFLIAARRGHFIEYAVDKCSDGIVYIWNVLFLNPVKLVSFLLLLAIMISAWQHIVRRTGKICFLPRNILRANREMRRVQKFVEKRTGIIRDADITLSEWAKKTGDAKISAIIAQYEKIRYRRKDCSEEDITEFLKECAGLTSDNPENRQ